MEINWVNPISIVNSAITSIDFLASSIVIATEFNQVILNLIFKIFIMFSVNSHPWNIFVWWVQAFSNISNFVLGLVSVFAVVTG